ncbi:hypothetical protein ACQ4PT_037333 [Festuca glaucescens]
MEGRARGGAAPRTAMDYTLAALKLFGSQLSGSTTAPDSEGSSAALMLFNIRFQRAWIQVPVSLPRLFLPRRRPSFHSHSSLGALTTCSGRQGVIVHADYSTDGGTLFLDDGSSVTELLLQADDAKGQPWRPGSHPSCNLCYFGLVFSVS